nr:4-coumarate--CoA ligase-like 9 [Procambarus clarkii]
MLVRRPTTDVIRAKELRNMMLNAPGGQEAKKDNAGYQEVKKDAAKGQETNKDAAGDQDAKKNNVGALETKEDNTVGQEANEDSVRRQGAMGDGAGHKATKNGEGLKKVKEGQTVGGPRILRWDDSARLPSIPDINFSMFVLSELTKHGEQVALDVLLVLLAVMLRGAACVPVSPALSPEEVGEVVRVSGARWAVVGEVGVVVKEALVHLPQDTMSQVWALGQATGAPALASLMNTDLSQPTSQDSNLNPRTTKAMILFSTGTTGMPKGVMLSHTNLLTAFLQGKYLSGLRPPGSPRVTEKVLVMLPLYHGYGYTMMMNCLASGGTVVLMTNFIPEHFFHAIHKYKVTFAPVVPHIAQYLSNTAVLGQYDLSSLRAFGCGAGPVTASTLASITQKSGKVVGRGYGLTETCGTVASSWDNSDLPVGSVGKLYPYYEGKVVSLETGEMLSHHQEGELCVRGPSLMLGYAKDPQSTATAIDPEGWFHTGDIAYYDEKNFIFLTDRIKDIIKVKGFQVSPAELERVIRGAVGVEEAVVVGVPSERYGEVPRAWVVPAHHAHLDPAHLQQYVAERVTDLKQLRGGVEVVGALPKNSLGKVLKRQLRSTFIALKPSPEAPQAGSCVAGGL